MKKIFLACLLCLTSFLLQAQQVAFPGAEGFGRYAVGGRNGTVYHVTNLNDSGPGSLRDAVSEPNRIVVFDVSGVIKINSRLVFSRNLTIAGQTAPGDGITVYGNGVSFSGASNTICRYIRFRMGSGGDSGKDACGAANGTDMIFDHVSVSWGRDENFSLSSDGKPVGNITIQNSIIGQGLHSHSCGGLIQTDEYGVTLFRNLYIDNHTRNPKVKGLNQFVNNVVYNWGAGAGYILGDSEGSSWATIVNNYFINGPVPLVYSNGDDRYTNPAAPYTRANKNFQLYAEGNYYDNNSNGVLDGTLSQQAAYGPAYWVTDLTGGWNPLKPIPALHPEISSQHATAKEAYEWIVEHVGARLPNRDTVDNYLIDELTSLGTKGAIIDKESALGLPNKVGLVFSAPKPLDSDNDGIPDAWETANGLDPNDPSDAMQLAGNGYVHLENYINSIDTPFEFLRYPIELSANFTSPTNVVLRWKNVETKATEIIIEQSTDRVNYEVIATLTPETTELTVPIEEGKFCSFRIKTKNATLESEYSTQVKLNDELKQAGGGTPGGTETFIPKEGKYYRILNYASVAYNSSADFTGDPKYLTLTNSDAIGSTTTFQWNNPAILWEFIEDGEGSWMIRNLGAAKYFANTSTDNVTTATEQANGGYRFVYAQDANPSKSGTSMVYAFYRMHHGEAQLRPREFESKWFWTDGSMNRADMLYTFVEIDKADLALYTDVLENLIDEASSLSGKAQVGPDLLQYPFDAKEAFDEEIARAIQLLEDMDHFSIQQTDVNNTVLALQSAMSSFKATQILYSTVGSQKTVDIGKDYEGGGTSSTVESASKLNFSSGRTQYSFNEVFHLRFGGNTAYRGSDKKSTYKNTTSGNVPWVDLNAGYVEGYTPDRDIVSLKFNGTTADPNNATKAAVVFSSDKDFDPNAVIAYATIDVAKCRAGDAGAVVDNLPEGIRSFRLYKSLGLSENGAGGYTTVEEDQAGIIVGAKGQQYRLCYLKVVLEDNGNSSVVLLPVEGERKVLSKEYVDLLGRKIKSNVKGVLIETVRYDDGTVESKKIVSNK